MHQTKHYVQKTKDWAKRTKQSTMYRKLKTAKRTKQSTMYRKPKTEQNVPNKALCTEN
jgi:hypothetical protein